jgi:hypothetical protein
MANDADLEYASTPADAEYEHTDIEPSIAVKFAIWLAIAMLLSVGIVYGTFWLFEGREQAVNQAMQQYPLAVGRQVEPPAPRLQWQPFRDVYLLKQEQREHLHSYGWVDRTAGVVHIPIEEAMRLALERGVIATQPAEPANLGAVVQESSSGRTATRR